MSWAKEHLAVILFSLGGTGFLVGGVVTYTMGTAASSWLGVGGEIVETDIVIRSQVESGQPTYKPIVTYTYAVGGRDYRSSRVTLFAVAYSSKSRALEVTRQYAPGTPTTVYYDPANPASAVLDRGVQPLVPIGLGVCSVMLFAFAGASYRELRARAKRA